MDLSGRVTAAIEKFFPEAQRAAVAEALSAYSDAGHEREAERVHLLILKISRRDVERVRSLVQAAKRDYRDVIVWASHPTRKYIVGILRPGPNAMPGRAEKLNLSSLEKWKKDGTIVIGDASYIRTALGATRTGSTSSPWTRSRRPRSW